MIETDPRTHYLITDMGVDSQGICRAYLTWTADSTGRYPPICELDFNQLNIEVLQIMDGSLGHGWIYYRNR